MIPRAPANAGADMPPAPDQPLKILHAVRTPVGGIFRHILDLANVSNYWIEAVNGAVILFALFLARIVGGESTAEEK